MRITIYSSPTCHACKQAKEFLKENDIKYKEIDITKDDKAVDIMQKKYGAMSLPLIVFKNKKGKEEIIIGYSKSKLKKIIDD